MPKLYDLQELVYLTGLPERTVRYYLAKVLGAPGGTRGRKAFYPQETLDQLKLAKQILMEPYDPKRGEVKPSLRDFQQWLQNHSAEEIGTMAEMPYRIKPKALMSTNQPATPIVRDRQDRQRAWQSFRFGDDLEIKIRKWLSPAQKQQLSLAGQLLQSMLEKE